MGALGCRCGGKPHDIPPFGALPITQAAVLLANRTIGDARLSGSVLGTVPQSAPVVPARLFLRSGFLCINQIANTVGIHVPDEPEPNSKISLTYEEFLAAVERMRAVDFPIERDPAEAWPDFVGWRVNYEQAAYSLAAALDVVPTLWSGPRKTGDPPIPPIRPRQGHPPK